MENQTKYFNVSANKYVGDKDFFVVRPASINNPKDNSVMFITKTYIKAASILETCRECLVFWPEDEHIPNEIVKRHAVFKCGDPREYYCRFFQDNNITNYPNVEEVNIVNGAFIAKKAIVGQNSIVFPGAYIGGDVLIGDNCYIGSGVKILGTVRIGNNVVIRENSVIGADGLSTNRDEEGKALTMPQFGGVIIEDNAQIGALTVIARGAIDNTIIKKGAKIDNSSFISHNVTIGEDTFVVGETIMFGSSSTGSRAFISGNSTVRDGRHIGDDAIVGMGAVVTKNVNNNEIVKGNPAR